MKEFFSMGKTMKKLISVVMSLALLLTSAGVIFSGSDVKGAAAEVVSSMDYYSMMDQQLHIQELVQSAMDL